MRGRASRGSEGPQILRLQVTDRARQGVGDRTDSTGAETEEIVRAAYPRLPWYEVSTVGDVLNKKTGHRPKPYLVNGYPTVGLTTYSKPKQYMVGIHLLLLETFVGPCPEGMECRHLDGNRGNFSLDNLRWGTVSENRYDAVKHGTHVDNRGERHGQAKLTEAQVKDIRLAYATGMVSQARLAKVYRVCQNQISLIVLRRNWKHV